MAQTEAQLRANKKYREEKLESITFRVPKGNKARIQAHAPLTGSLPTHSFTARSTKPSTAKNSPMQSEPPHRAVF